MKSALIGILLLALGGIAVATGILPWPEVGELWDRVWPILAFVIAITVVTELAAEAGLFRALARGLAFISRGRIWLLWTLVVITALVCTIFLSLDTTAVLLTPVVLAIVWYARLDALPFAFATVWIANAGSLLFPVSNLTNLLAQHELNLSPFGFASLMGPAAAAAVAVPIAALVVIYRRSLRGRFIVRDDATAVDDPVLLWIAGVAVAALIPALLSGIALWIPSVACAAILLVALQWRGKAIAWRGLLPIPLVLLTSGLFLSVQALHSLGLGTALSALSGTGTGVWDLLRMSFSGLVGANLIDNLPAYLALEPAAGGDPLRLGALLIGVNAGALITPWASLATLLWRDRLRPTHVELPWKTFIVLGAVVAPLSVATATFALALSARA